MVPLVLDITANLPAPKVALRQLLVDGMARLVQVMPSGDVAAEVDPNDAAKNELLPYAKATHDAVAGKVLAVQSIPFVEVAAMVPDVLDKATKIPPPKTICVQFDDDGIVTEIQDAPSEETADVLDPVEVATKTPLP